MFLASRIWRYGLPLGMGFSLILNAYATVYQTVPETLDRFFGKDAKVEKIRVYLSEEQLQKAREAAGKNVDIQSALVTHYKGKIQGNEYGYAYFDNHLVRTLDETIGVLVSEDGTLKKIDVLSFNEPREYQAPAEWIDTLLENQLADDFTLKGKIHGITGATLTVRAIADSLRRILAVHGVLYGDSSKKVGSDR